MPMNSIINNFNQKELSGRDARLWQEWKEIDTLCCKRKEASANPRQPSISYIIRKKNAMGLPTEYEIWYRVKSIIGVKDTPIPREPVFGYLHKMSIVLPNNYPSADGNPIFSFCRVVSGIFSHDLVYVVFVNRVVQYFNDDLSDIYGQCSTLYQTIAKDILKPQEGVFYCTDVEQPVYEDLFSPLGEWP